LLIRRVGTAHAGFMNGAKSQYCSFKPVRPELVEGLPAQSKASTSSARTVLGLTEQY